MPALQSLVLDWFDEHARELPWRGVQASPWSVMVSEFMLQQTPVARVLPVHEAWLARWPTPSALAAEAPGEAVRLWGRLGYPRRALRLHSAAQVIVERHQGQVPPSYDDLLALPGVGDYTAAAIASFAFGQRQVVLDTNIRRVLIRALGSEEFPPQSVTRAERALAESLLPEDPGTAATWSNGLMELGALVCSAAKPGCTRCPLRDQCGWRAAGHPPHAGPPRKGQTYAGTDRQCRGRLLAVLRDAEGSVTQARLDLAWVDDAQRGRCLSSLIDDGLAVRIGNDRFALP